MTSLQICTQGASKQVETWWGVVWRGLHGPGRPRLPGPAPRSFSCALLRFADVEGLGQPCVWQVCRRWVPQRVLAGLPESCSVLLTTVQTSPAIGDLGVACVMVSGRDELHPRALANLPGECAWGPRHATRRLPPASARAEMGPCPLRFRPLRLPESEVTFTLHLLLLLAGFLSSSRSLSGGESAFFRSRFQDRKRPGLRHSCSLDHSCFQLLRSWP